MSKEGVYSSILPTAFLCGGVMGSVVTFGDDIYRCAGEPQ